MASFTMRSLTSQQAAGNALATEFNPSVSTSIIWMNAVQVKIA
jgi:hypothetical protein